MGRKPGERSVPSLLRCYRLAAGVKDGNPIGPGIKGAVGHLKELLDRDPVTFMERWDRLERLWLEVYRPKPRVKPVVDVAPPPAVEEPEPDPDGLEPVEVDTAWMGADK